MKHFLQRKSIRLHAVCWLFLLALLAWKDSTAQQLTGTRTVPSTDYATIFNVIDSLNTYPVGPGGITFNIDAGVTETAPLNGYKLTGTGTATNPITIRKNPLTSGNNPLITSWTGGTSTTLDGVFFLLGSDYVTIDGIDIVENGANTTPALQMEFGFALLNKSGAAPFDGCNNNTIKNSSISLNRLNTASRGIYLNHHTVSSISVLTLTAVGDAHSNNKFYANKIQNVYSGIFMNGYADATYNLVDKNNDIGGSSYLTADTITALGLGSTSGATSFANGVYMNNQMNANVSYNYIDNALNGSAASSTTTGIYAITSAGQSLSNHITLTYNRIISTTSGTGGSYCMNIQNYDGNINISNNDIKILGAVTSAQRYGIFTTHAASPIGVATYTFKNNTAQDFTINNQSGLVYIFYIGTINQTIQDIGFNTIYNVDRINATTGGLYGFYSGSSVLSQSYPGSSTNFYNNTVKKISTSNTGTGVLMAINNSGNSIANYYNNVIDSISCITGQCAITGINQIGGGDISVYYNTVTNITGTRDLFGVSITAATKSALVYNNKIGDLTSAGSTNNACAISLTNTGSDVTRIYNNKIYRITESAAGTTTAQGINIINGASGVTTSYVPVYIYNNIIGTIRAPFSSTTANPGVMGINLGTSTSPYTAYVRYNNVYLNDTAGPNTNSAAIYNVYTANKLVLNNNLLVNTTYHAAGTGNACGIMRNGTVLTSYDVTSGNNLIYAGTPSVRNLVYFDGTNKDSLMLTFKARVAPREAASVSQNIAMFSGTSVPPVTPADAHYLQNDTTVASMAENGALNIAGITTDMRGVIRQGNPGYTGTGSKPDIGAFESGGTGVNMVYDSVIVVKNTANTLVGYADQSVVNIQVHTSGNSSTLSATQFNLSTSGTTNVTDIAKAKVYYTGSSATFSNATPFGSVVVSPTGAFSISGSQTLLAGANHFWLAYDISSSAVVGNVVDGSVTNVVVGSTTKTPLNGNPVGGRTIASPLAGTYLIGQAPYMTLAAIITDLNSNGVSAPVTVNLAPGFTETAPAGGYVLGSAILNASLNANRRLTFQKLGAGISPLLTSPVGTTATLDGIFTLSGTDYVTIDGIDLIDNNTGTNTVMMEWGYGLLKAANVNGTYDGCQNVIIKNSSITLKIADAASVGIYANNHLVGDANLLALTNTSETNSYNTIIGNTIQNVNTGIGFRGLALTGNNLFPDVNNIIGDSAAGNTINNFGGGIAGFGIVTFNNANASIRYNVVDNAAGGGIPATAVQLGITNNYTYTGLNTGGVNMSNNDVTITVGQATVLAVTCIATHNTHGKVIMNNNNVKWVTPGTGAATNSSFIGVGFNVTGGSLNMADFLSFKGNTAKNFTFTTVGTTTFKAFSVMGSAMSEDISYDSIYNITRIASTTPAGTITLFDNYTTNNPSPVNTPAAVRNIHDLYIVNYNNGATTGGSVTALNIGNAYNINLYNNRISSIAQGNVGNTLYGINASAAIMNFKAYNNIVDTLIGGTGSVYGFGLTNGYGLTNEINNNTISNLSALGTGASHAVALLITNGGRSAKVFNNKIYNIGTTSTGAAYASGILLVNMASIANLNQAPLKIYNNLIGGITNPSGTSNPSVTGISIAYAASTTQPNAHLYNNTISLSGSTANNMHSAGIFTMNTSTGTFKLSNNIVLNNITPLGTGNATALYRGAATLVAFDATSNNNIYWAGTPGINNLIYFDGTNKDQTITAYRTRVYPRESGSETQNVNMVSTTPTDPLYLCPDATSGSVSNSGLPIAGNTTDFNNTARSATTPDIGAYEGNFNLNDITAPSVTIAPVSNIGAATSSVTFTATIRDASGTANVASGVGPRVYFKKQGGAYQSDAGTFVSGNAINGVWSFTINATAMTSWAVNDTISYYVVAQDLGNILGSGPFGVSGSGVTSITADPVPYQFAVINGLSGTLSVCASGCTFTSLSNQYGAFDSINKSALTGNLTLTIDGDLLDETGAIGINSIAQPTNYGVTIVPGSASEKLIVGSTLTSGYGIVNFTGGDNVTIDGRFAGSGRYLRIRNRNTNGVTVRFVNDSKRDTVRYVNIEGLTTVLATVYFGSPATGGTGNDSNAIMYCDISDTLGNGINSSITSMMVPNTAIYSDGNFNSNNTIAYNNMYNYLYGGVFLAAGKELHDNWTIHQNAFYQLPAVQAKAGNAAISGTAQQAMTINSGEGHTITNNSIGGSDPNRGGAPSKSMYLSGSSAVAYYGIGLGNYLGMEQTTTISGNTISNIDANPTQGLHAFCGILVVSGKVNIVNNTIGGGAMPFDTIKEGSSSIGNAGAITIGGGIVTVSGNTIGNISNYASANSAVTILRTAGINVNSSGINTPYLYSIVNNTIRDIKSNYNYTGSRNLLNPEGLSPVGIFTVANAFITMNIEGNTIYNMTNTSNLGFTAQANGITIRGGSCTVQRNKIYNINTTGTGAGTNACGVYGIEVISSSSLGHVIKNNQISLNPTSTDANVVGIADATTVSARNSIVNNSVYIGGTTTGSSNSYAILTGAATSSTVVEIKNNILYNGRSGGSASHFAAANYAVTNTINPIDFGYNLMVSPSMSTMIENTTGVSMNVADVNAMYTKKSVNTNWMETSSNVTAAALFANTANANLGLNANNAASWYANGKGLPMSSVTNDFTNASRSTSIAAGASDIGSVEVTPSVAPASAVASASPALNTTTNYTYGNKVVASVTWGATGTVPTSLDVKYYSGTNAPSLVAGRTQYNAYYAVTPTGGAGYTYNMSLAYDSAVMGNVESVAASRMAYYKTAGWVWLNTSSANETSGLVSSGTNLAASTLPANFTGTSFSNPLPVTLVKFDGVAVQGDVQLVWATANEVNNLGFDVERSIDGRTFKTVGFVKGAGNSSKLLNYQLMDNNAFKATGSNGLYYRLKQVDMDGNTDYSEVVYVAESSNETIEVSLYPNPATDVLNISAMVTTPGTMDITIMDIQGRVVSKQSNPTVKGINTITMDPSSLNGVGIYFVKVTVDGESKVLKLMKH